MTDEDVDYNANATTMPPLSEEPSDPVADIGILKANLNDLFLVLMGAIILFMQLGFALLEAGSVRSKNVTNILMKNVVDMCVGWLAFWLCGYGLAFGEGNPFMGLNFFIAIDLPKDQFSFMFFQGTFATTCATIISGAISERSDFIGYIIFSIIVTGIIYPIQTHWMWGPDGFLGANGYYDFAGSGVIHLAGGICALVACIIVGARHGRFGEKGQLEDLRSHSTTLGAQGFFILVFGFLAFNGGSQASINAAGDGPVVSSIFLVTIIACAAGALVVLAFAKWNTGFWKLGETVNGGLAGMVSVCCGCDGFALYTACLVGAIGGLFYIGISQVLSKLKVDDPVNAVAVHGGGGIWGLLAGPIFRSGGLLGEDVSDGLEMLLWNVIGMGCIIAWNAVTSILLFGTLHKVGVLRVKKHVEIMGLDAGKHDERAYPEFTEQGTAIHTLMENGTLGINAHGNIFQRRAISPEK